MSDTLRRFFIVLLVAVIGGQNLAHAGIVGTAEGLAARAPASAAEGRQMLRDALAREEVRAELEAHGVDPAMAELRVAALSDAEVAAVMGRVDSAPAGSGVLVAVGVTFVVLIILEIVGVIDVFKGI